MTLEEIDVRKLNVMAGDVLIVRTQAILPAATIARIIAVFNTRFVAAGVSPPPIMVLDAGASVEIVRPVAA